MEVGGWFEEAMMLMLWEKTPEKVLLLVMEWTIDVMVLESYLME